MSAEPATAYRRNPTPSKNREASSEAKFQALVPEAVAEDAGEHADQHPDRVERGGDEAGLDQRETELLALQGQRGRDLADVGAADEAAGVDRPRGPPAGPDHYAAFTGIFSSTIFFCQASGPDWCTETPFESTATVTGMSCTSNS